jgi:hypothetical protein
MKGCLTKAKSFILKKNTKGKISTKVIINGSLGASIVKFPSRRFIDIGIDATNK